MGAGKVFGAEASGIQQRNGERIAEGQGCGGAGGWGQVVRAGFLFDSRIEVNVGFAGQCRGRGSGHRECGRLHC